MEENIMIEKIERAIHESATEQIDHLRRGRVERTFTVNLANKLKQIFEAGVVAVDPFYNRLGEDAKKLDGGSIELDIAIHERGVKTNNLVAIELETINKPKRDDIEKLKGLTRNGGDYEYRLGLFLVVGISKRAGEIIAMEWYKDGGPL